MKKIIVTTAIISLAIISCKKKYSCECTTTSDYSRRGFVFQDVNKSSATQYSNKMTKKQAQAACDHEKESVQSTFENSFSENGTVTSNATVVTTCELK